MIPPASQATGLSGAQAVDGPALVWFEIAEEQNVFPMIPAGGSYKDIILEPDA